MVDRARGEARDKARDSHNPLDVLTANAIPASLGLEQAGAVMETDRTKWLVALCTAGWLFKSQANVHSTIFSVGAIICLVMGKVRGHPLLSRGVEVLLPSPNLSDQPPPVARRF